MRKTTLSIIILILFSISCKYDRVYNNRQFRYKVTYPQGWIAVNSGHNRRAEENFIETLKRESFLLNYETVDVAFYNPNSKPPIYEMISFRADQSRFNINNLNQSIPQLIDLFTLQLAGKFSNVENLSADMYSFQRGKIFRFDFSFTHQNQDYISYYYIIPGRLFATYFVNGICRFENKEKFYSTLTNVLNSFKKY